MTVSFQKHFATAVITDPEEVTARCQKSGIKSEVGAIFVKIPEAGFEGTNLIYCRYGLSIPYIRVQEGAKLWVEPTIEGKHRWVYTGFADCGGGITPHSDMQLVIELLSQVIYATTAGTLHLSADDAEEPFVLGNALNTYLSNLVSAINTALGTKMDTPGTVGTLTPPSGILSTKIYGE